MKMHLRANKPKDGMNTMMTKTEFLAIDPNGLDCIRWNRNERNEPVTKAEFLATDHDGWDCARWNENERNEPV